MMREIAHAGGTSIRLLEEPVRWAKATFFSCLAGPIAACLLAALFLTSPAQAETLLSSPASLSSLLIVPAVSERVPTADETLAEALAGGRELGLERKNPFRKRSIDLFRSEHDVEFLRQEMRVRFRLRPKSRETMSVEVKF